jgi:hypothetical protein
VALPLTDGRWWPLAKAVAYVEANVGDDHIARHDFAAAVNGGDVPCKIEHHNQRTGERSRCLLTVRDYEMTARGLLRPRTTDIWTQGPRTTEELERNRRIAARYPLIMPRYALFFWSPRIKKIWPDEASEADEAGDLSSPLKPTRAAKAKRRKGGRSRVYNHPAIKRIANSLMRKRKNRPNSLARLMEKVRDACDAADPCIKIPAPTQFKAIVGPVYRKHQPKPQ